MAKAADFVEAVPDRLNAVLGAVLRQFREAAGVSQEALSFQCGVHRTYISLVERGRNSPSIKTLWAITAALDVRPSEVFAAVEAELAG